MPLWSGRCRTRPRRNIPERDVSAGYLSGLGARLLRGRYFTEAEDDRNKPSLYIRRITDMAPPSPDLINDSNSAYLHRSSAWLTGGFAGLALLLSVVGLYGVISYSVSQRTREIGVRMALGAQRNSVYRLILKEAGWLTAAGVFAGLVCSVAAATLMRSLLFGIRAWDAPTLAAVSVLLGLFALLASYFPARRAASVNPVDALRAE